MCLAAVASAADVTGNWKADLQTPQGMVEVSYVFSQNGEALTGTWQAAKSPTIQITEGKVKGNAISFEVKLPENGGMVFAHEGKIKGDEIQFTMKPSGEFPGTTVLAKRAR
jgi:hypothetical protein